MKAQSYDAMAKALLRLAAAKDTKPAGDLGGDTAQFIALGSYVAFNNASHLITHNGNVYRPFAQTATCLHDDEETNMSQKPVDPSVRQQLARDTPRKEKSMQNSARS